MYYWRQLKNNIYEQYKISINTIDISTKQSNIKEGILTKYEFIMSGDYLIDNSEIIKWNWNSGEKQYLICKDIIVKNDFDIIIKTENDYCLIMEQPIIINEIEKDLEIDPACIYIKNEINKLYDIIITYDEYTQTPHIWFYGHTIDGNPISIDEMLKDINKEHIEIISNSYLPYVNTYYLSIHPCNHATVMKKIIALFTDDNKEFDVNEYLIIFLKFIMTVMPNINLFI